jgi:predicted unusual protein kinase regulating ubiquinone biosynthesis (AarF/ABC1/UbiB family)
MYIIEWLEKMKFIEGIFRQVWAIGCIFWILGSESILYLLFHNWSNYIQRLATRLASVNILYVKVFQAIASNNNLIDESTNRELLRFTDNAPWNYNDIQLYELIEVTNSFDLYLKDGCESPINAGMISLVFKACKRSTGELLIIKMKRKNIDIKLNHAIENLKTLLYFLSFIPFFHKYQISNVIDKNIEIIRHQTNFQEEVENIIKVKNNCANLKYVKIPEVFAEVTQKYPDFIMMEYIDGVKINQVCEEDYVGFSKQVLKFGLVTTIVHGVTHGDLHSGNILFIKDASDEKYPHKIGVIDFGIIFEIENAYKETLFEFLTQLFDRPPRQSVIHLLNSVIIKDNDIIYKIPQKDYESIVNIGVELFTEALHNAQNVNQIQLYKFMAKIKEYLNKKELMDLGIQPSDNFVKMQLVLAMAHGVTLTLCKNNFVSLMDDVLNELFHTKMILEE